MGWKIRRWPEFPFDDLAGKIRHHKIFSTHLVIGYAARFDRNEVFRTVDSTYISECMQHKTTPNQFQVRVQYGSAQFL